MTQVPPVPSEPSTQRPHRGAMILVFGILSWIICFIFGIFAWVMGSTDLAEMDAGRMDPSGRGLTQAGKLLGMIHIGVMIVGAVLGLLFLIISGLAAGASGP